MATVILSGLLHSPVIIPVLSLDQMIDLCEHGMP